MSKTNPESHSLKEKLAFLRQEIESLERHAEGLYASGGAPGEDVDLAESLGRVRDGVRQILQTTSAPTALNLLLIQASHFGERAVLFLSRKGNLWAWSGLGRGGVKLGISSLTLDPEESPLLTSALQSQRCESGTGPEPWEARLGEPSAGGRVAVPIPGRERCSGLLWFDTGPLATPGAVEAVECLATTAGAALEMIALRRAPTPPGGGRVTADESAIRSPLPYSVFEGQEAGEQAPASSTSGNAPDPSLGGQHEDARRLARLLISEIRLYNEEKVALGRKSRDLCTRLRNDINRSRQTYEERISQEVRDATDYFQAELIKTLADGDASLLGPVTAAAS
ncbi:MAG: hypothetical protein V3U86_09255 [Acidobacteriota bacterium]|nr:hypothetical protein [Acidobacteriota bacterium]